MSRTKRRNQRRNPLSVPLAVSLFLSTALVVLAVSAALAGLLLQAQVSGVQERADDLLGRSVERLRLQSEAVASQAERALALARDLIVAAPPESLTYDTLRNTLTPVLAHFPAIAGLSVGGPGKLWWLAYPDGDSWLTRSEMEDGVYWERWDRKDGSRLNFEVQAHIADDPPRTSMNDPELVALAASALSERSDKNLGASPAIVWSQALRLDRTQVPGLAAALAFHTPAGVPCLIAVDTDWRTVSDDSARIYDLRPEHTLIATEAGTLLAPPRRVAAAAEPGALPKIDAIAEHPLARALRRFTTDTYPPTAAFLQQDAGGAWWFAVEPLKLGMNQTLFLTAGITEAHLLSQERGLGIALAVGAGIALLLAALFAVLYARALNAPLKEFLRRTKRIDFLTRSASLRPKSRLREVDQLYAALDDLCEAVIEQLEARDIPMVVHAAPVKKRTAEEAAEALAVGTPAPEVPAPENDEQLPITAEHAEMYVPEAYIQALQATRRQLRQAQARGDEARDIVAKAEKSIEAREMRWKTARESAREIARIAAHGAGRLNDTLGELPQAIAQGMAVAACGVWLRDEESGWYRCASRFDRLRNAFIPGPDLDPAEHPVLLAAIASLPYLGVSDFQTDPRTNTLPPLWPGELLPEPILIAPWFRDGVLTGFVLIEDATGARHWDAAEESLALLAAAAIARVLDAGRAPAPEPEAKPDELAENPEDQYAESPVYRQLLDSTRGVVLAVNAEGRIVFVNPAAEMRYELLAPDLIGRPLAELAASGNAEADTEALHQVLHGEARVDSITEHVSASGKTLHLHLTWSALEDESGEVVGAVVLATDIAEIQERRALASPAESRYQAIVEKLGGVLFAVDTLGRINYVSPGILPLYGFQPGELTGLPIAAVADDTQGPRDLAAFEQMMQGRVCGGYHAVHRRKDGGSVKVVVFASTTRNEDGETDGAVGVAFSEPQ